MAGIGFELKRLADRKGMLAPAASLGHATVIAAGPWLLTVIALGLIQAGSTFETEARDQAVQSLIIYSFCLSLLATAPVTAIAIREASDRIYLKRFERLTPLFLTALLVSVLCGLVAGGLVFGLGFRMGGMDLAWASLSVAILSAMWPAMAFCGMMRRYGAITRAFVVGLAAAIGLTLLVRRADLDAAVEAAAFALGLGLTTILLQASFTATFPPEERPQHSPAARRQRRGLIAVGATLSAASLWIDSWLMWAGPLGVASRDGLSTAPFYDSVMFIARMSMVPALAFFVIWVETAIFDRVVAYIATIRGTGTLRRIEEEATALRHTLRRMMGTVLLVQFMASAALALLAHSAVEAAGLLFQQTGILRNGAIGVFFHLGFLAASTMLLFLDRLAAFAWLQGLFLVLNLILTALSLALPPEAYGLGYMAAAALSAFAAIFVLENTSDDIVALTFAEAHRPPSSAPRWPALGWPAWGRRSRPGDAI